jgi:hypothetical protein
VRLAECRHALPANQATGPVAGIIDSSVKSGRVAVTDHVLARCKIKMLSIEWNSSADNALLSALGEGVASNGIGPLARAQVKVATGRGHLQGCGR